MQQDNVKEALCQELCGYAMLGLHKCHEKNWQSSKYAAKVIKHEVKTQAILNNSQLKGVQLGIAIEEMSPGIMAPACEVTVKCVSKDNFIIYLVSKAPTATTHVEDTIVDEPEPLEPYEGTPKAAPQMRMLRSHIPFQTNPAEDKLIETWAKGLGQSLEDDMRSKFEHIKKVVMDELGYTEDRQLMPLGLKTHLERLAGHRFNYLEMFKDDIKYQDEASLRRQLYFFNLLAALNTVGSYLKGEWAGHEEVMVEGKATDEIPHVQV
jgi:hypothetical protein